jgi:hypothetical protein
MTLYISCSKQACQGELDFTNTDKNYVMKLPSVNLRIKPFSLGNCHLINFFGRETKFFQIPLSNFIEKYILT